MTERRPPSAWGLVVTSHPAAVDAGLEALAAGGTAADAAVAAAAVLCVVDPRSTGIGGDAFAQYWLPGDSAPVGLAASGPAPAGLSVEALLDAGFPEMPAAGPWSITVPGAVAGWELLLGRFGKLGLDRVLEPAADLAESGFQVTPVVAEEWVATVEKLAADRAARDILLPGGRAPRSGERFRNHDLGRTLRAIGRDGAHALYRGELAELIGEAVRSAGGPLRPEDLADWVGPEWISPLRWPFRGVDVFELPPPGQGVVVLEALGIYEGFTVDDPLDRIHLSIESIKLALADARAYVTDPSRHPVPVDRILRPEYLGGRRAEVDPSRAIAADPGRPGDTVYVATIDADGAACSFIQSLYDGFGSGVGVPGTGIVLQNRGAGFVLDKTHPNRPEPGKRPYHTIIPAMLGCDGAFLGALGVVGGFMQPQGQVQILLGILEEGLDSQAAVDRPRFRCLGGLRVGFEEGFDPNLTAALAARGHQVTSLSRFEAGGAQVILRKGDGYVGASDSRKDGYVGSR